MELILVLTNGFEQKKLEKINESMILVQLHAYAYSQ